jgi:hypothetical protein
MRLAESTLPPDFYSFDFSPSEMKFLKRIGGSSGSFVMNDYRTWRKGKAGAIDQAFLEKLKRYRFCSVSPGPGYQRIDLVSRPFFRLIEMENSRIRRHQGQARQKALLCSAYLSQCPHRVLITPKEKVKIVTTQLFVPESVIPKTVYRGRSGLSTVQYFLSDFRSLCEGLRGRRLIQSRSWESYTLTIQNAAILALTGSCSVTRTFWRP